MVFEAIKTLKERNGSSLQAIKKYMVTTYPELATKFSPYQLRSALKKGTEAGKFIKVSRISCTIGGWKYDRSVSCSFLSCPLRCRWFPRADVERQWR